MVDKSIVTEWLKKADSDFQFASTALEDTKYFSQICFLFQQAAEKYLKACIIAHELPFKKIHDLGVLLNELKEKFPQFSKLSEHADFLTGFYIEARYPDSISSPLSKETAQEAKNAASNIQHFVKEFLGY